LTISDPRKIKGLLAHSAQAAEERRKFSALRRPPPSLPDNRGQLKHFLLSSGIGVTGVFVFGIVLFLSGLAGP
jgi:hypothetical protein